MIKRFSPNRRCDQSDLNHNKHQDAKPQAEIIVTHAKIENGDNGKNDRHREQDHRQAIHDAAEKQVHQQDKGQNQPRRESLLPHPGRGRLRQLGQGQEVIVNARCQNNEKNHCG